jgi:hypothetical protein
MHFLSKWHDYLLANLKIGAIEEIVIMSTEIVTPQLLESAYDLWLSRQNRDSHPAGTFDNAGRWYPCKEERLDCCEGIRKPSRDYPFSLIQHCRSIVHVAALHGVTPKALRSRIAQDRVPAQRHGGDDYYKSVAVVNGRFFSIFDGKTEYCLNQQVADRARKNHAGGIYVYQTLDEALSARVPISSALFDAHRIVFRVRAEGQYCTYDSGKLAFSRVTPLELVG